MNRRAPAVVVHAVSALFLVCALAAGRGMHVAHVARANSAAAGTSSGSHVQVFHTSQWFREHGISLSFRSSSQNNVSYYIGSNGQLTPGLMAQFTRGIWIETDRAVSWTSS